MALQERSPDASVDTSTAQFAEQLSGFVAGEKIDALAACYIGTNGRIFMSNGTAADEAAKVDGFAAAEASAGQAVTLFGRGTRARYATGMTPSTLFYLGTTPGRLDTSTTTGGTVAIAKAISSTEIRVVNIVP